MHLRQNTRFISSYGHTKISPVSFETKLKVSNNTENSYCILLSLKKIIKKKDH